MKHFKKAIFSLAILATVSCLVFTGCTLPDPLKEKIEESTENETENEVEQVMLYNGYVHYKTILRTATVYSSIPEINLKYQYFIYHLENDQLQFIEGNQKVLAGDMVPIELTKENFDDMCSSTGNTANTLQSIRENNESAWKISVEDEKGMPFVCYFLKQTNQAEPILVFFTYGTTIDVIFQITPVKPTELPNSEALINDFLNGNPDQLDSLYFSNTSTSAYFGYSFYIEANQTCTMSIKPSRRSSTLGPFVRFDYIWDQEKIVASKDGKTIFTLTPSGGGFIFTKDKWAAGSVQGVGGQNGSYLELPSDGTFFVLSGYTYKK